MCIHSMAESDTDSTSCKRRRIEYYPGSEFFKWTALYQLDPEFLSNVKLAYIFGSRPDQTVALITFNDEFYLAGGNVHGSLGTGDTKLYTTFTPVKIDKLCQKGICNFSFGDDGSCLALLALTEGGEIYSWGYNEYGELGLGYSSDPSVAEEPQLVTGLEDHKIIQLVCGADHAFGLTTEGKLYGWGYNYSGQVGNGDRLNVHTPVFISALSNDKISMVSCGKYHSVALTVNGMVYSWGQNERGQLGQGHCKIEVLPSEVRLPSNVFIKKIACGPFFSMALSYNGELYSWGCNQTGQLGRETQSNKAKLPGLVEFDSPFAVKGTKVADIALVINSDLCAAKSEDGTIYIWGNIRGFEQPRPMKTNLKSILDCFAFYSVPQATYIPIHRTRRIQIDIPSLEAGPSEEIFCSSSDDDNLIQPATKVPCCTPDYFRSAFDDQSTSDISFSVQGKLINCHKAILKIKSTYFRSTFEEHQVDSGDRYVLKIPDDIKYPIYRAMLKYFYTDMVELESQFSEDYAELLKLADSIDAHYLRDACGNILQKFLSPQNVVEYFKLAQFCEVDRLKTAAFNFMIENHSKLYDLGKFSDLDQETLKMVVEALKTKE